MEKNKKDVKCYLLHNKVGKMFFINVKVGDRNIYTLPGNYEQFRQDETYRMFLDEIAKQKDKLVYLCTHHINNTKLKIVDNIPIEEPDNYKKIFYSLYVEEDEDFNRLNAFFSQFGYTCYLMSAKEIKHAIYRANMDSNETHPFVTYGVKKACRVLQKKLTYEIY